jgi:hypothetical protein
MEDGLGRRDPVLGGTPALSRFAGARSKSERTNGLLAAMWHNERRTAKAFQGTSMAFRGDE